MIGRASLVLGSGSVVAQAIALVTSIVVSSLYSPATYGVFSFVVVCAGLLVPLATLRYEAATVPAGSESEAKSIVRLASLLAVASSLGLAAVIGLLAVIGREDVTIAGHYVWFVPLLVLVNALFAILTQAAVRLQEWRPLAIRAVLQNVGIGMSQILLSAVSRLPSSLLTGETLGRSAGVLLLWRSGVGGWIRRAPRSRHGLRQVARQQRDLPTRYLPSTFFDLLDAALPVLLVAHYFGSAQSGFVAMALRIVAAPIALVGAAVGQALLGTIGATTRSGLDQNDSAEIRRLAKWLGGVGLGASLLIALLGPQLFGLLFGSEWAPAGDLMPSLAFAVAVAVMWNPLSSLFIVYEAWKQFLNIAIARVALSLLLAMVAIRVQSSFDVVVLAVTSGSALVQLMGVAWILRRSGALGRHK